VALAIAGVLALGSVATTASVALAKTSGPVAHVLLISVDGLHQSDLTQCEATFLCPTLAALTGAGTSFTQVSTSEPSDSAPGLMAIVSGADPKLTGVYYDDSYDRTMYTPAAQTATSTQTCAGAPGAETMYAENVDVNAPSTANGQVGTRPILNAAIDPTQLPYQVVGGSCVPVEPNDFLRTNTIFSVAHAAGLRTAWADKHPVYNLEVAGHGTPGSVDDPFNTEINADVIPATLVDTRGRTVTFPLNGAGAVITNSVADTEAYDQIKVDALLNEIDGKTSAGTGTPGTPALYGMNFQAVSVGQKLVDPSQAVPGGYEPGSLAFTPQLSGALGFVDGALHSLVTELASTGELANTELIVTAKHGQSPIDPAQLAKIGHAENTVIDAAGVTRAQTTDDDVALVWLAHQAQTPTAVAALLADQAGPNTARVDYVLSGPALAARFNSPLVDPRTPDLIIQPIPGTIYSHSSAKVAEHGGFAPDDTHVALIATSGADLLAGRNGHVVKKAVTTAQVAPTILQLLGLDPGQLDAVRLEGTAVLPGL
jgi:hypothetical protein